MHLSQGKGLMLTASSSTGRKYGEGISDPFPAGLRVLVVDDDQICLRVLEKMLQSCHYEVKTCNRAEEALSMLRRIKNGFDIVISDVHMPDMDGFKLLVHIGLEMDLPVIMMSADDSKTVVMKGVTHGACDYLIKPVRLEAIKNIWQHVVRKKRNELKDLEQSGSADDGDWEKKPSEDADYSSSANEGNWRNSKKRKDDEDEHEERDDTSTLKKPRVVWSVELHQQFVAAVNQLEIDKAVPKKILELMNVPGLTRENVASHLQKYRLYLRRLSGVSHHQSNLNNSFISPQEATYRRISPLNGFDLQTIAINQIPSQNLTTLQASGLGRSTIKSVTHTSHVDQTNLFNFENPKLRFGEGQQQNLCTNKPMNLLHGIPATVGPRPLSNLHHSTQYQGNIAMKMTQPQARGPILNESIGSNILNVPTSIGQSSLSNRVAGYNLVPSASSALNLPISQTAELPGNSFPLQTNPGMLSVTSKGGFAEEFNSGIKGFGGLTGSYDVFSGLHQQKSHNWDLLNFNASQNVNPLQASVDVSPSVLVHQGFSSSQRDRQGKKEGKLMFSSDEGTEREIVSHNFNPLFVNNSVTVKTERISDPSCHSNNLFPGNFGQDDLMIALLKQQQEGIGPAENEFDFDGISIDNIPV